MSRMIAWVAREPTTLRAAIGTPALDAFARLAKLHADGWGLARTAEAGIAVTTSVAPFSLAAHARAIDLRARAGILYLRFASSGTPPSPSSAQPFSEDGLAFAHNGAFDRGVALRLLSDTARATLRGSSDSEIYFAMVRERLHTGATAANGLADAARSLRTVASDACLNALLLTADTLHVARSTAGRPAPVGSFAARGWNADQLPLGHGAEYNELRITEIHPGVRVIATTGFPQVGWRNLPDDVTATITADAVSITPLETP